MRPWREVYGGIRHPVRGQTVLGTFIDERADEMKLELRLLVERAARRISPVIELEFRRKRLNPINSPDILI